MSFNASLSSLEKVGRWSRAAHCVAHLDLQPSVVTCSALISSCEKGRAWQHALRSFQARSQHSLAGQQSAGYSYSFYHGALFSLRELNRFLHDACMRTAFWPR